LSNAVCRSTTSRSTGRCCGSHHCWPRPPRPCRAAVGDRWQVDETYVKVGGRWRYSYRAIDQFGQFIDVFISARRDADAACRFFERAINATKVTPTEVTTDQASAYR
jgi:transposase-like protein